MRRGLLCAALLLCFASPASAAYFTSAPPAVVTDGTGPFTWTFQSDGSGIESAVAYGISTEGGSWHRCLVPNYQSVTLSNLAPGGYTIAIANDININALGNQLYSGINTCGSATTWPSGTVTTSNLFVQPAPVATTPAVGCSAFTSQLAAQIYLGGTPSAPNLDADGDGIPCEDNPCPCSTQWHLQHDPPIVAPALPAIPTAPVVTHGPSRACRDARVRLRRDKRAVRKARTRKAKRRLLNDERRARRLVAAHC